MDNVPVRVGSAAPTGRSSGEGRSNPSAPTPKQSKRRVKLPLIGAVTLVILALLVAGGWMLYRSSTAAAIDSSKYQAVFFTNGQVYFGKLHTLNNNYMKLTDIFYLQAKDPSTNADSKNPQETSTQQSPDVQLVKLGNEVHGPVDEMIISKDQMLFFENLKKDGKVAASIGQYKNPK